MVTMGTHAIKVIANVALINCTILGVLSLEIAFMKYPVIELSQFYS